MQGNACQYPPAAACSHLGAQGQAGLESFGDTDLQQWTFAVAVQGVNAQAQFRGHSRVEQAFQPVVVRITGGPVVASHCRDKGLDQFLVFHLVTGLGMPEGLVCGHIRTCPGCRQPGNQYRKGYPDAGPEIKTH